MNVILFILLSRKLYHNYYVEGRCQKPQSRETLACPKTIEHDMCRFPLEMATTIKTTTNFWLYIKISQLLIAPAPLKRVEKIEAVCTEWMVCTPWKYRTWSVHSRGGILAENKFWISDDLFRIHFGRTSISVKFRIICINFG